MIPIIQTVHTDDDGNCLAASICSILEIEIERFPELPPVCPDWVEQTNVFLNTLGYHLYLINYPLKLIKGYHLIIGTRGKDRHCVVGLNGEIVHNPSPYVTGKGHRLKRCFAGLIVKILR